MTSTLTPVSAPRGTRVLSVTKVSVLSVKLGHPGWIPDIAVKLIQTKKSINRSLNLLFYVCSQQDDISQQQQQNKQTNLYKLYKLTHRTMNNWLNNRSYRISIIQNISYSVSCSQIRTVRDMYYSHSQARASCTQTGTYSWGQILTVWEMYYSHSQARAGCTQTGTDSCSQILTVGELYYSNAQTRVWCSQTWTDSCNQILTVREMYYSNVKHVCNVLKQEQTSQQLKPNPHCTNDVLQ